MSASLPRPCASEGEYLRFHHLDLQDASPVRLRVERYEAVRALARLLRSGRDPVMVFGAGETIRASEWWRERLQRTERVRRAPRRPVAEPSNQGPRRRQNAPSCD